MAATVFGPSNAHFVYADANCDEAVNSPNPQGIFKGNSKQCNELPNTEGPKEPVRTCNSPNEFKDK